MGDGIKFSDTVDTKALSVGRCVIDPSGQIGGPTHKTEFFASIKNTENNYVLYSDKQGPIIEENLIWGFDVSNYTSYRNDLSINQVWDLANNENNGILTNGLLYDSDDGGSFLFDGVDDYIELVNIDSTNPLSLFGETAVTWDFWIKPQSTGDSYQRIIDKSNGPTGSSGWSIMIGSSTAAVKEIQLNINGIVVFVYSGTEYQFNQWNHIVITRDNNLTSYYLNGSFITSQTNTSSFPSTTTGCRIGTWNHSTSREFKGNIGSIFIYNKSFNLSEVLQNYNATRERFGI